MGMQVSKTRLTMIQASGRYKGDSRLRALDGERDGENIEQPKKTKSLERNREHQSIGANWRRSKHFREHDSTGRAERTKAVVMLEEHQGYTKGCTPWVYPHGTQYWVPCTPDSGQLL